MRMMKIYLRACPLPTGSLKMHFNRAVAYSFTGKLSCSYCVPNRGEKGLSARRTFKGQLEEWMEPSHK